MRSPPASVNADGRTERRDAQQRGEAPRRVNHVTGDDALRVAADLAREQLALTARTSGTRGGNETRGQRDSSLVAQPL